MSWDEKIRQARNEERNKLLTLTDAQAELLPTPDRYQRMRYQREIEGYEFVRNCRRNLPPIKSTAEIYKPKNETKSRSNF